MSERPRASAARLVVAGRLLLVFVAGAAVVAGALVEWRRQTVSRDDAVRWACPMHPDVVASASASCPICGMALERVASLAPHDATAPATAAGSADVASFAAGGVVSTLRGPLVAIRAWDMTTPIRGPAGVDEAHRVVALLNHDEVAALAAGESGTFIATALPAAVEVRRSGDPPTARDASTAFVRFDVAGATELRPGIVGSVDFAPRSRRVLLVPNASVIDSPAGPYVLVASTDGRTFTKRSVQIGGTHSTFAILLSGAHATERVVATDAFFVDAERRLRSQSPAGGTSGAAR